MDEEDSRTRRGGPTFEPPVYRQRYDFVENIVCEFGAKKVYINIPNTCSYKKQRCLLGLNSR